jgi:hypothetical protein
MDEEIDNLVHIDWMYPDGVHAREELRLLEPDSRNYDDPCPCGNCRRDRRESA